MNILGVEVPPLAIALGSMIGAFILGIGMGLGSEIAKYYVQKYLTRRLDKVIVKAQKLLGVLYGRYRKK